MQSDPFLREEDAGDSMKTYLILPWDRQDESAGQHSRCADNRARSCSSSASATGKGSVIFVACGVVCDGVSQDPPAAIQLYFTRSGLRVSQIFSLLP